MDDVEQYVGSGLNYSIATLDRSIVHFFRLAVSNVVLVPCTFYTEPVQQIVPEAGDERRLYESSGFMAQWNVDWSCIWTFVVNVLCNGFTYRLTRRNL